MNSARSTRTSIRASIGLCTLLLSFIACVYPKSEESKHSDGGGASSSVSPPTKRPEILGRVVVGYQGWFSAEGDGMKLGYHHYGRGRSFGPESITIDYWPDMAEAGPGERFATDFRHSDGKVAYVFSSAHPETVLRHFRWMKQHGIGGAILQRFAYVLRGAPTRAFLDRVLANVRQASRETGVPWALMYDMTGLREGNVEALLLEDLRGLIDRDDFRRDPFYLHHQGRPLVAIWGVGFRGRKYSIASTAKLFRLLKGDGRYGGNAVMAGVPYWWRQLHSDATRDAKLLEQLAKVDIVSPWAVGRVRTPEHAATLGQSVLEPDLKWLRARGVSYLPVNFPGFSWHNLMIDEPIRKARLDAIPRLEGRFLWRQAVAAKRAGAKMLYVAMFDEINEGTAIFKVDPNPPAGPTRFLTYGDLPSDHYLWLTGQIQQMLRGNIPATDELPHRK